MEEDRVSIVITTRNRSELLKRAVASALGQTYRNVEVIIVDDCSWDHTPHVVQRLQQADNRVVYVRNDKPSGANVARNKGILAASGKFIAGLDDDDEFLPQRIATLLESYDPTYAFITSLNRIDCDGRQTYNQAPEVVTLEQMWEKNILMNQGLIEKNRLVDVGLYDTQLKAYQDYDMWIRLMLRYGAVKVVQQCLQIVYFDQTRERISTATQQRFSGYFQWYQKYKSFMNVRQKKNHLAFFYTIRHKSMSYRVFSLLQTPQNLNSLVYLLEGGNPAYQIFQEFHQKIEKLNKQRSYILYGFGSIGQMILPLLKPHIVGVIDRNLEDEFIEGIPVLSLEKLCDYDGACVIVTPLPYRDEIVQSLQNYPVTFIHLW